MSRCKALGIVPDKKNLWSFFISEIKRNLHVVLAFSPVGDDFRNRAKKFPALVNCTVIDWFQPWPKQALFAVGQKFMNEVEIKIPAVKAAIERFLPYSFGVVQELAEKFKRVERRFVYMTPKSYLELLKLYGGLLNAKRVLQDAVRFFAFFFSLKTCLFNLFFFLSFLACLTFDPRLSLLSFSELSTHTNRVPQGHRASGQRSH